MTVNDFLIDAKSRGKTRQEAEAKLAELRSSNFRFDDDTEQPQPEAAPQKEQPSTDYIGDIKSAGSSRLDAAKSAINNPQLNKLSTVLNVAGQGAGFLGDVAASTLKRGALDPLASLGAAIQPKGMTETLNRAGESVAGAISKPAGAIAEKYGEFKEANPNIAASAEGLANIASVVPVGKFTSMAGKGAVGMAGRGVEMLGEGVARAGKVESSLGKAILKGEAKINKNIAQKAAPSFTDGKTKIINDIEKYNLQSTKKGFSGITENAEAAIEQRMAIGSEALKKASAENPNLKINLDGLTARYRDELKTGDAIPFDEIERADKIREEITDKLKEQLGFDVDEVAEFSLAEAERARKLLSKGVYKKGAFSQTDPIRDQIKQDMALRIRDEMAKHVPELTEANKEIRDLINIKKATDEAYTRISGHNQIFGAGNVIAGGTGALLGGGNPLTALALVGAKKGLESGRGASGLMSLGRSTQSLGSKIGSVGRKLSPDYSELGKINLKR